MILSRAPTQMQRRHEYGEFPETRDSGLRHSFSVDVKTSAFAKKKEHGLEQVYPTGTTAPTSKITAT